jgi:hypothetical protein
MIARTGPAAHRWRRACRRRRVLPAGYGRVFEVIDIAFPRHGEGSLETAFEQDGDRTVADRMAAGLRHDPP